MAKCSSCGRDIGFQFGKKLCRWCVEHEAAQRGEGGDDQIQRVMPTPWKGGAAAASASFNKLFIGVNLLVFMAMVGSGISLTSPHSAQLIRWGGNYGPLTFTGQTWRLITYMFLHAGILHIGFNVWCLWSLGDLAESLYGDWLYALIYLLSGIGGGIASMAWHPATVSVGASGAIFGVVGALIASLKLGEFSLPRPMISSTLRNVLIFAVYSLVFGAMRGGTDNACHIGGLVTGLVLGALVAVSAADRDRIFMRIVICVAVLAALAGCERWVENTRGRAVIAQHGIALLQEGRFDEAISTLQRALAQAPNNADLHFYLAVAYAKKLQFADEGSELKRVLELEPNNKAAQYNLGSVYLAEKKFPEAQRIFQELVTLDPKSPDAHYGLGSVAMAEKNYPEALKEFKTTTELDPDDGAYYDMGLSYAQLQRHDEAITAFKDQINKLGDDRETELALAASYRAKGMTKEADEATAKAAQLKQ